MHSFLKKILFVFILLISKEVSSFNTSTYLVANTAFTFFDFDKAKDKFVLFEKKLNESDLHNQLLTFVNLNMPIEANSVAIKIIELNKLNEEAWIVHLTSAIINKDQDAFIFFKKNSNNLKMDLLNYIFFSNDGKVKNNSKIARSIFEIIQASASNSNDQNSYKFLLFYLSIAIMIEPNFNEAYFYSAKIYQILKNYSKAESFYKKISNKHNLYIESQKNIAINKSKIGFHEEGIAFLKNLLNEVDYNKDLILAIADLYRIQHNYEESIIYYTKILDLGYSSYNEYWKILYLRGICFERLKKWDQAEKDFIQSLKINPKSSDTLNYLAYGWLERNINLDKALEMLKEAHQYSPNSYYISDSLAWAFYKKNKLKKAVNLMEKVIIMAPGEAVSLDHLGDIYYAMNRKREAAYFWKQALDLAETNDEIIDGLIKKLKIYNAG